MNVLLVKSWGDSFNWDHSHLIGLAYLAAYIREKGHKVTIVDAAFAGYSKERLLQEMVNNNADVVGVTAMTHEIPRARNIFKSIKEKCRSIHTVIGGPHVTARPTETLAEIADLDFVVSGEGERPFSALLDRLEKGSNDYTGIEGLAFRGGAAIHYNGNQTNFVDLQSIPQPAVDLYYSDNWFINHPKREYRLFASRGCPFRCIYCVRALGGQVRWRDPEAVVEEWVKAVRYYGARHIFVGDEIFLYDNPTVHAILDGILRSGIHKQAQFGTMTHIKLLNRDLLKKAAEANCDNVCIGIESGNNEILKNSGRTYSIDEAREAVWQIKNTGIKPRAFFILGHPGETHKTILDTIMAAVRLNPYEIGLGVMVPYPGTKIYDMAKNNQGGFRLTGTDWGGYDRYGGRALEFDNFKRWQLTAYQVLGFCMFYLLNGRFISFYRYLRPRVRAVFHIITGKGT
jgi:anaerobic magnesium-protoporphyrin IX monomethyl ester cyclase